VNAVGERFSNGGAGLERTQNGDGLDGSAREFRRDVVSDASEPDNLHVKTFTGGHGPFKIDAIEVLETHHEGAPDHGLSDRLRVQCELVAQGRSDEVERFE